MFVYYTDQAHNYADQAGPYKESKSKKFLNPKNIELSDKIEDYCSFA